MLRHERMSVAMALAAATHHSAQRGEWRELHEAPRGQRTASAEATYEAPRSQTTSVAGDTEFFSLFEEELGGTRPDRLSEVRPQGRVQRHTVEQIVDTVLFAPSLDVPVPQMGDQLVEVCRQLDVRIPEQVIEMPKISSPARPCRRRVRFAEQTAEQLVEVPTIISYSSLRGIVEQNVNIPVPGRGVQHVGLQGFLPRQSSRTSSFSQERSSERTVEQIVDSRVLGGVSSASSSSSRKHAGEGFLALFPGEKVRRWARTRVRGCPPVSAHPRRRLSWRVSSLMRTTMCGCGFFLDKGCCWARTRMSSAMSPVRACLRCSGWSRLCGMQRHIPAVFVGQWMVPFFSSPTEWWILPLCSETGTHSVTLCFFGLVIDMPVVVHVKVVVYLVMAQRPFPLDHSDSSFAVH